MNIPLTPIGIDPLTYILNPPRYVNATDPPAPELVVPPVIPLPVKTETPAPHFPTDRVYIAPPPITEGGIAPIPKRMTDAPLGSKEAFIEYVTSTGLTEHYEIGLGYGSLSNAYKSLAPIVEPPVVPENIDIVQRTVDKINMLQGTTKELPSQLPDPSQTDEKSFQGWLEYVSGFALQSGIIEPTLPLALTGHTPLGQGESGESSAGTFSPERLSSDEQLPKGSLSDAIDLYTPKLPDIKGALKWIGIGILALAGIWLAGKFITRAKK